MTLGGPCFDYQFPKSRFESPVEATPLDTFGQDRTTADMRTAATTLGGACFDYETQSHGRPLSSPAMLLRHSPTGPSSVADREGFQWPDR